MNRELQLKHEEESDINARVVRLKRLTEKAAAGDVFIPRARILILRMASAVQEILEEEKQKTAVGLNAKYRQWLRDLPTDVAALTAVRACMSCCGVEGAARVQRLTSEVGKLWEIEVRIKKAEAVDWKAMQDFHKRMEAHGAKHGTVNFRKAYSCATNLVFQGHIDITLSSSEMMQLGKFGVDACIQAGLLTAHRVHTKKGVVQMLDLAPEVKHFLDGYTDKDVQNVFCKDQLRMLCPPEDWTTLADGGYLTQRRKAYYSLLNILRLRQDARAKVVQDFTAENMPEVFAAANYLQSVPYMGHEPTMKAIIRVWNKGGGVMGVPSVHEPVPPPFPYSAEWTKEGSPKEEVEQFILWKRSKMQWYEDCIAWRSKRREVGGFIRLSTETVDKPLWFPVHADLRGRWYYRGSPSPQGSDMAKASLHFQEKRALGHRGVFWLKVHIANSYGYDKERFEERAKWTEQHWGMFERALDAPEDYPELWGDSPWCCYSAAWELREAYRSGKPHEYCTGIPVHMDATCSGLQHFAAILRDSTGAKYVNLVDSEKIGPKQDIYARVAALAMDQVQVDSTSEDPKTSAIAQWWLNVGISRNMAKKPVMTYVYGATLITTAADIEDALRTDILPKLNLKAPPEYSLNACARYIAAALFKGIAETVPAAAELMQWLRHTVRFRGTHDRMNWKSPTGFIVQHDYRSLVTKRVMLRSCGVVYITSKEYIPKCDNLKMVNSVAPNFVHALDGAHLTRTALAAKANGLCMVGIHDSYGTHPSDVDELHKLLRAEFVRMYTETDVLQDFLDDTGLDSELPAKGTLDLESVKDSEFFFS